MISDGARQRLYVANPGLNRLEVFDVRTRQFLSPITVGQLPRSMAFGSDGNTLYVANAGGENISIVDLAQGKAVGRVRFPPIPFNAGFGLITPAVIASSQRGPQVIMSDGTLWKIVGDTVTPRILNPNIFGRRAPFRLPDSGHPREGSFACFGRERRGYLYSATEDDFVSTRQVIPAPIKATTGPSLPGWRQYYLANDQC
jgi:DNA-binding beta-propeller fold protein YncE